MLRVMKLAVELFSELCNGNTRVGISEEETCQIGYISVIYFIFLSLKFGTKRHAVFRRVIFLGEGKKKKSLTKGYYKM